MFFSPQLILLFSVVVVGVLHTIVPDHWVPITLIARQKGWTKAETTRAALQAGIGHVVTTLLIAVIVWVAGVAFATRFGHYVDLASSLALIGFGGWIMVASLPELRHKHLYDTPGHTHVHKEGKANRTALLLVLGSSPMVEGIPAFFAAGKYGLKLIIPMAFLFAVSTIATYVVLCVYSTNKLKNVKFEAFERYGEVLSGAFIALIGLIFLAWPVL